MSLSAIRAGRRRRCVTGHGAVRPHRHSSSLCRMIILGAPGSGKGTHSCRLVERASFDMVGMGDILRRSSSPEVQRSISQGTLLPDETVMKVVQPELSRMRDRDWILDGLPRNERQAVLLDDMLERNSLPLNLVIALRVPDEVILERIEGRFIHKPSGRVYNTTYNPPRVEGKDDLTGEALEKRADDTAEVFAKRLRLFHRENEPILDHYRRQSNCDGQAKLVQLSGRTSDEIFPRLCDVLASRFRHLAMH